MTKSEREALDELAQKIRKSLEGVKALKDLKEARVTILEAIEELETMTRSEEKPSEEEVDEDDFV